MRYTDEEIAEAGKRAERELKEQGLAVAVTDPAILAPLARALNASLGVEDDELEAA